MVLSKTLLFGAREIPGKMKEDLNVFKGLTQYSMNASVHGQKIDK